MKQRNRTQDLLSQAARIALSARALSSPEEKRHLDAQGRLRKTLLGARHTLRPDPVACPKIFSFQTYRPDNWN
jgi:hypothetical protein